MGRLDGKVAVITGAARGTGAATAQLFVSEGAKVVIADVLDDRGKATAEQLGQAARYFHCDVTEEQDWAQLISYAVDQFGSLNVLVNNAGVCRLNKIQDTTLEDYFLITKVNQLGTFLGVRAAIDAMREAGGGSIINISSIAGHSPAPRCSVYAASKFAIRGITKVAALELGRYGIRVNAICPASGNREMVLEALPPDLLEIFTNSSASAPDTTTGPPLGKLGGMEDVARAALFLASDESSCFSGADFMLDGGITAGTNMGGFPD
jgi:3alpha(or 20beta)-hydroxysteroid dehydrogenase